MSPHHSAITSMPSCRYLYAVEIPMPASQASWASSRPPQHQLRRAAHRTGAAPDPCPDPTPMGQQRRGHRHQGFFGHVADGRVAEHVGSFAELGFLVETDPQARTPRPALTTRTPVTPAPSEKTSVQGRNASPMHLSNHSGCGSARNRRSAISQTSPTLTSLSKYMPLSNTPAEGAMVPGGTPWSLVSKQYDVARAESPSLSITEFTTQCLEWVPRAAIPISKPFLSAAAPRRLPGCAETSGGPKDSNDPSFVKQATAPSISPRSKAWQYRASTKRTPS